VGRRPTNAVLQGRRVSAPNLLRKWALGPPSRFPNQCKTYFESSFSCSDIRASPECRNRFGVLVACAKRPSYFAFVGLRPTNVILQGRRVSAPNLLRRWALGPPSRFPNQWRAYFASNFSCSDVRACPECRNRFGVLVASAKRPSYFAFLGLRPTNVILQGRRVSAPNLLRRWALGPPSRFPNQ